FLYDLPRLLQLGDVEQQLQRRPEPALHVLRPLPRGSDTPHLPIPSPLEGGGAVTTIAVLPGSFNPLTRGHEALVAPAWREDVDAVLLVLPGRAIDKEGVARAALVDRALVLLQWAARHGGAGVALVN